MATPAETDALLVWLREIAKNTAETRNAVMGRGGSAPSAAAQTDTGTRFERATEALARRFESALARWQRTPVEGLVNSAFNTVTQKLDQVAGTLLNNARGLANRGFQGTLEGARFDYAMERLSRQFAAVMMPIMQGMTYFAEQIESRMRRMGGAEYAHSINTENVNSVSTNINNSRFISGLSYCLGPSPLEINNRCQPRFLQLVQRKTQNLHGRRLLPARHFPARRRRGLIAPHHLPAGFGPLQRAAKLAPVRRHLGSAFQRIRRLGRRPYGRLQRHLDDLAGETFEILLTA